MKYLVVVGASAGGLKALEGFVKSLPTEIDSAVVIIQHLSPDYKSLMAELLENHTKIPIKVVESEMKLEKNHIFLIPAGFTMTINEKHFLLRERNSEALPINTFMSSAATLYKNRCIGVILSGSGFDGTLGCERIRECGGLILAQNPESAEFDSMPRSIVHHHLEHKVIEAKTIWSTIEAFNGDPTKFTELPSMPSDEISIENGGAYTELFVFLKRVYQLDFSKYKINSVTRRIQRRMEINSIENINEYMVFLKENESETNDLYRDLLIGVTSFFRDPSVYDKLKELVLEPQLSSQSPDDQFRVWVAGCASGEEAYSMAILIDEVAREKKYSGKVSIFATDAHKESIRKSSQGVYNKHEIKNVSEERRKKYFKVIEGGGFKIRPEIRQRVIFAQHNLLQDPPFTHMNLVSCRNMLIYFKPDAQEIAIHSLFYALDMKAHLLLGSSEALGKFEKKFDTLAPTEKIYQKIADIKQNKRPQQLFEKPFKSSLPTHRNMVHNDMTSIEVSLLNSYDSLLAEYMPAGVLINKDREVKHYFGEVSKYLKTLRGRVSHDLLLELSGDLRLTVSLGIQRVLNHDEALEDQVFHSTSRHEEEIIRVVIRQILRDKHRNEILFVGFDSIEEKADINLIDSSSELRISPESLDEQERINMLEYELRSTKENLQNTVEELQTSNEELQAINEEMQVSNEELQSTNEELHSMNEELHSVNAELQEKNGQLIELNNDHESLLESTEDGVLFLDNHLRIKRFNKNISFAFSLIYEDLGRPIEHIRYKLNNADAMLKDIHEVLRNNKSLQRKEVSKEGVYYLRRFSPFYDQDHELQGVVLTFTDISEIHHLRGRLQRALNAAKMVWWEWDIPSDQLIVHAEDGNCILGYNCNAITPTSKFWFDQLHHDDYDRVQQELHECLDGTRESWSSEHRYIRPNSDEYAWVYEVGEVILRDDHGSPLKMAGTTMNIDASKQINESLETTKDKAVISERSKSNFLSHMSHEIRTPLNGIIGMAELLKDRDHTEDEGQDYLDTIYQSSNVLYSLINNILEYSKAEAGKVEILRDVTDIVKEVNAIGLILRGLTIEKKITIDYEYNLKNKYFLIDGHRLTQILLNLIGNAIKFSPEASLVKIIVDELKNDQLQFRVIDQGVGIDKKLQGGLFKPFSQSDSSITKTFGGTGLGLSICRELVELMGGSISLESEPNVGSTFSFVINARAATQTFSNLNSSKIYDSLINDVQRVLVVDDNLTNLKMLKILLKKMNIMVDTAESGKQALSLMENQSYDLCFLDIHMPEMSGLQLATKIRDGEGGENHSLTPLIACTADTDSETQRNAKESGMEYLLTKPIKKADLKRIMSLVTKDFQ